MESIIKSFALHITFLLGSVILNAQVNTEAIRFEENVDSFRNQFKLDLGYEKASSEVLDLSAEYRLDYIRKDKDHSFIVANIENGYEKELNEPKNIITSKGFVHLRSSKYITKKQQLELFLQYEFNEFLLLKDRYLIGGGVRTPFNKIDFLNGFIGMGLMYEKEVYNLNPKNENTLLRSTNYIKNNIELSSNINFDNTCYFQVATNNLSDYRILYDSEFKFDVIDSFSFTIGLNYRYDNTPHGNLGKSYLQLANGISFNF